MKGKKSKNGVVTISMTKETSAGLFLALVKAAEQIKNLNDISNIRTLLYLNQVAEVIEELNYQSTYTSIFD